VRNFARHGARIGLIARGVDGLKAAQREVEKLGGEALMIPTDVGNAEQVEAAAEQIEAELGQIDIWVNNAMTSVFSPIKKMTPDEFRRFTSVRTNP
jgi:NAD(P)-dependent dehydrogenase (short-subunit alcohol dehydrogenase family)